MGRKAKPSHSKQDFSKNIAELGIEKEILSINALLAKNGYDGRVFYATKTYCNLYAYKTKEEAAKMQQGLGKLEPNLWSDCDAPAHAYFDHKVEEADIIVKYDNELDWFYEVKEHVPEYSMLLDEIYILLKLAKTGVVMVKNTNKVKENLENKL